MEAGLVRGSDDHDSDDGSEEEDEIKKVKKGERNQSRKKIYIFIEKV